MRHSCLTLRAFAAALLLLLGAASAAASSDSSEEQAVSLLQSAYARAVIAGEQADMHRELLATVLQRIKRSNATPVDLTALAAAAAHVVEPLPPAAGDPADVFKKTIREVLRTLDPHSRYLDPRAHDNFRSDSSGGFGGLGLEVEASNGAVRVVAPMPGSPAARAGLAKGDLIVRVDGESLGGVALADAIAKMRGQPGTQVSITIQRSGAEEFTVSLTRDTIRRPSMRWSMEGDVLVLRLSSFSGSAEASVAQAVAEATAKSQPRAVVLDLRGNPGGFLREAVKVADAFLAEGEIVSLRGGSSTRQRTWTADASELLPGVPMVVLVNSGSASASELVADALQHSGRATVMGQRSYGKGSVQTIFPLGENKGALKLTTSLYHGPSGQTVHRVGVGPEIELIAPPRTETAGTDAAPPRAPKARIDPVRCSAVKAADPELTCAVAFLQAGSTEAFVARLAQ